MANYKARVLGKCGWPGCIHDPGSEIENQQNGDVFGKFCSLHTYRVLDLLAKHDEMFTWQEMSKRPYKEYA